MNVTRKLLSELRRPERNVRMHTDKQLKEFRRSIEMFGQIRPIVADEDGDTLSEYGTIDEERIEEIRDARERTEAREEAAARNAEEYVPPAAGTQPQEEGPARRFILCPKCGERIWL